jgi:hypothetical protein
MFAHDISNLIVCCECVDYMGELATQQRMTMAKKTNGEDKLNEKY